MLPDGFEKCSLLIDLIAWFPVEIIRAEKTLRE